MPALNVSQTIEKCDFSPSLLGGVQRWLERVYAQQELLPLALFGVISQELPWIVHELHRATQRLFGLDGPEQMRTAKTLHRDLLTYGEQPLLAWEGGTLFVEGIADLSEQSQTELLQQLRRSRCLQEHRLLLLLAYPTPPSGAPMRELQALCPMQLQLPPLHQRNSDIDRLICQLTQQIIQAHEITDVEGFSLEATAHIHRAVLQTRQTSAALYEFLLDLLLCAKNGRLPLHHGYVVAWPTVRRLEDLWGYRLSQRDPFYQELVEYDFQERLFSASIEHASCRSGFSKSLIELQCQLLSQLIEELPPHQRNYQGMTARADQLQWIGMKLLSNARTQAELRDFFGFGGDGKIPKATAKLKFDQYELEHYGYRATDPLPWQNHDETPLPQGARFSQTATLHSSPVPADEAVPASKRQVLQVEGELSETLFWQHQDLFTVLAADALTVEEIATLMKVPVDRAAADLHQLVEYGFLKQEGSRFSLDGHDVYYRHSHSRLRCIEENLMRYLDAAFAAKSSDCILDNWFLRLPEEGLPMLRRTLFQPFLEERFLPLSDPSHVPVDTVVSSPYNKRMYVLMLLGTHRLSAQVHGRLPLKQRILYYFREASLQRADRLQQEQAICLRATQMLSPDKVSDAMRHLQALRKQLRAFLPHGRGNKPNFNLTLCFTEVPLMFYRDTTVLQADDIFYQTLVSPLK